jgi:hypothetical protein
MAWETKWLKVLDACVKNKKRCWMLFYICGLYLVCILRLFNCEDCPYQVIIFTVHLTGSRTFPGPMLVINISRNSEVSANVIVKQK